MLPDPVRVSAKCAEPLGREVLWGVAINNFGCGWAPFSLVWDAAAVLDVDGAAMRDELVSKLGVRVLRTGR